MNNLEIKGSNDSHGYFPISKMLSVDELPKTSLINSRVPQITLRYLS